MQGIDQMQYKLDVQLLVTHVSTGPFLTIDHIYITQSLQYRLERTTQLPINKCPDTTQSRYPASDTRIKDYLTVHTLPDLVRLLLPVALVHSRGMLALFSLSFCFSFKADAATPRFFCGCSSKLSTALRFPCGAGASTVC